MASFALLIEDRDLKTGEVFSSSRLEKHGWDSPEQFLKEMRKRRKNATHHENGYIQRKAIGTWLNGQAEEVEHSVTVIAGE